MATNIVAVLVVGCVISSITAAASTDATINGSSEVPIDKHCASHNLTTGFGFVCMQVYEYCDENDDKQVTESEFYNAMGTSNPDREYVRAYFLFLDLNNDGVFDHRDEPLLYDRVDQNNDNHVSFEESMDDGDVVDVTLPFVFMSQLPYVQNKTDRVTDMNRTGLEQLLQYMPHNSNGSVSEKDYVEMYISKFGLYPQEDHEAKVYFRYLDSNHDGLVTTLEMGSLFPGLDTNNDGSLQLIEVMGIPKLLQNRASSKTKLNSTDI